MLPHIGALCPPSTTDLHNHVTSRYAGVAPFANHHDVTPASPTSHYNPQYPLC